MAHLLIGSLLLSILHAMLPGHWIPLVAISKAERWSAWETRWVTGIAGGAHTLSTILIGVVIGLVGYRLSESYQVVTRLVAPLVLVLLGAVYVIGGLKHTHDHRLDRALGRAKRTKAGIVLSLAVAMFFSPCLEIEAYYFTAGTYGWGGMATVSAVYFVVTVSGMVVFVDLARRGVQKIESHFLEHHEWVISGAVLVALGIAVYFVNL